MSPLGYPLASRGAAVEAAAAIGVGSARGLGAGELVRVALAAELAEVVVCRAARADAVRGQATTTMAKTVSAVSCRRIVSESVGFVGWSSLGDVCEIAGESVRGRRRCSVP